MDPKIAEKPFERGYSIRKDKVGGLGLHWVANTVNSMEGRVDLASVGIGTEATARLKIRATCWPSNEKPS